MPSGLLAWNPTETKVAPTKSSQGRSRFQQDPLPHWSPIRGLLLTSEHLNSRPRKQNRYKPGCTEAESMPVWISTQTAKHVLKLAPQPQMGATAGLLATDLL